MLLAATIAALAWVNIDSSSYDRVWETHLSINLGDWGVDLDLRHWLNSGLMTFFFFVVGLEARVSRPIASPTITGSTPDSSSATQTAAPRMK